MRSHLTSRIHWFQGSSDEDALTHPQLTSSPEAQGHDQAELDVASCPVCVSGMWTWLVLGSGCNMVAADDDSKP